MERNVKRCSLGCFICLQHLLLDFTQNTTQVCHGKCLRQNFLLCDCGALAEGVCQQWQRGLDAGKCPCLQCVAHKTHPVLWRSLGYRWALLFASSRNFSLCRFVENISLFRKKFDRNGEKTSLTHNNGCHFGFLRQKKILWCFSVEFRILFVLILVFQCLFCWVFFFSPSVLMLIFFFGFCAWKLSNTLCLGMQCLASEQFYCFLWKQNDFPSVKAIEENAYPKCVRLLKGVCTSYVSISFAVVFRCSFYAEVFCAELKGFCFQAARLKAERSVWVTLPSSFVVFVDSTIPPSFNSFAKSTHTCQCNTTHAVDHIMQRCLDADKRPCLLRNWNVLYFLVKKMLCALL